MKDPYKQQGAFSWFELMTSDVDGAKKILRQSIRMEY